MSVLNTLVEFYSPVFPDLLLDRKFWTAVMNALPQRPESARNLKMSPRGNHSSSSPPPPPTRKSASEITSFILPGEDDVMGGISQKYTTAATNRRSTYHTKLFTEHQHHGHLDSARLTAVLTKIGTPTSEAVCAALIDRLTHVTSNVIGLEAFLLLVRVIEGNIAMHSDVMHVKGGSGSSRRNRPRASLLSSSPRRSSRFMPSSAVPAPQPTLKSLAARRQSQAPPAYGAAVVAEKRPINGGGASTAPTTARGGMSTARRSVSPNINNQHHINNNNNNNTNDNINNNHNNHNAPHTYYMSNGFVGPHTARRSASPRYYGHGQHTVSTFHPSKTESNFERMETLRVTMRSRTDDDLRKMNAARFVAKAREHHEAQIAKLRAYLGDITPRSCVSEVPTLRPNGNNNNEYVATNTQI
eukprot:PhM_4_TR8014/c0_g1_i1/m.40785